MCAYANFQIWIWVARVGNKTQCFSASDNGLRDKMYQLPHSTVRLQWNWWFADLVTPFSIILNQERQGRHPESSWPRRRQRWPSQRPSCAWQSQGRPPAVPGQLLGLRATFTICIASIICLLSLEKCCDWIRVVCTHPQPSALNRAPRSAAYLHPLSAWTMIVQRHYDQKQGLPL